MSYWTAKRTACTADVWTGSELRCTVWLDRAVDIAPAEFAWLNPALGTPDQFERAGIGWLRKLGGGLMTTHFGQAEQDGTEAFGLSEARMAPSIEAVGRVAAHHAGDKLLIGRRGHHGRRQCEGK